ncbi:MAG: ankyrin repeat domain-containing protein [Polaribacter sp.]|uniref:ankyrin repeat domain-containing protein n=1 Tax=Polaribacter sp. TaxID=1920175 RepID=UPI002F35D5D3
MKRLQILIIFALIINSSLIAQKSNIFHNRNFWKANPSIETIDKKITEGNDISQLNSNAFDAVVYAILEKTDNKTIKYLLSKAGNNVNKKTHDGRTYIFWAAYKNNLEIIKYVISKGAKTDIIDTHGNTFLNFAAATGQTDLDLYKYSFNIGSDIKHEKNHDGANALLLVAPYLKDFILVDLFLANGATLNDKDTNGNGLFEYASKGGNIPFLKNLIEKEVEKGDNAMIFASQGLRRKENTLETYKFLESIDVKANIVDIKGRNPLHAIAYNSESLETYKYFINKGVDINLQDNGGDSPFMNASNSNTLEVVKFLSNYLRNINLKDENGRSALAMAVNRNSVNVVKFLLEKEANINTVDENGNSLSYYLINTFRANKVTNFEDKLKVLLKNGLVINKIQNSGNTLLHLATERNNLSLLKRLKTFNIDVNTMNKNNLSTIQVAAMKAKNVNILKYLLSIGANKNIKTDFDETVYDLASENELLKKNNININFLK